MEEPDRP